jgi:enediyne biosynthesis protein E4
LGRGTALLLWLLFACSLAGLHHSGSMAQETWKIYPGYRFKPLEIPVTGQTGFQLLSPKELGVEWTSRLSPERYIQRQYLTSGSGVAIGDFDGDGLLDIYLCNKEGPNALLKNLGNWRFVDVAETYGVACADLSSSGAVFADLNGNGKLDLLVSNFDGSLLCFLNQGDGPFKEVGLQHGILGRDGSTSLALADFTGNGWLDLYACHFPVVAIFRDGVKFSTRMVGGRMAVTGRYAHRLKIVDDSLVELGEPDVFYLNQGEGRFEAVDWPQFFKDEHGQATAAPPDFGLAVQARDLTGNGAPDIYVCNDFQTPDRLWVNDGSGQFQAIGSLAMRQRSFASMGVDFADVNRNGLEDIFVVEMLATDHRIRARQQSATAHSQTRAAMEEFEMTPRNTFYFNRGDGTYAEIAYLTGLHASDWSWTVLFLDVDLDGYEDILVTNGHLHDFNDADAQAAMPAAATAAEGRKRALQFPPLNTPNVLFRNRGDLTFEQMGAAWGFDSPLISHGMALGDLDNDGALDVVVNALNAPPLIYRNQTVAPRVAVRLKGLPPNTQGIGAKLRLFGGAVPAQSQEVISGGRYLSGDDPMRVFAAGTATNVMRLEVDWRSGKRSVIEQVKANHLYEVDESGAVFVTSSNSEAPRSPHFENVSHLLLNHRHTDEPFDDFVRQSLLPRKLSGAGPGVAWFDLDGNGSEDLIIGSGKGGQLAVFRNPGDGALEPWRSDLLDQPVAQVQTTVLGWRDEQGNPLILTGSSNYQEGAPRGSLALEYDLQNGRVENGFPARDWSSGPLALGDMNGNGQLELFVGGRVRPGRYPEAVPSEIYRRSEGKWARDEENSALLQEVGLVNGALWTDLDGDGYPELVLACEWGPVRVFANENGRLRDATESWGLDLYPGWWQGVASGDFTGDGRMDLVATNWGRNSKYEHFRKHGLRLYHGDVTGDGSIEIVEAYWAGELDKWVPWRNLHVMGRVMPFIQERFSTFRAYGEAGLEEILGESLKDMNLVEAHWLESTVFLNQGGKFEAVPLPIKAQFAPAFGVVVADLDGDGHEDIFITQNFFGVTSEDSRYDAGRGLWIRGDGAGAFSIVKGQESGIKIWGEGRGAALADYDGDGRVDLAVAQHSGETRLYRNLGAKPGLRVRLRGPKGNPGGVGALVRVGDGNSWGPAREVQAGSGYWSQNSPVIVLGLGEWKEPLQVWVRWPGGKVTQQPLPPAAREIVVYFEEP